MNNAAQPVALKTELSLRTRAAARAALATGPVLWAALAALNLILFHGYIHQGYPLTPAVQVTAGKMILDALFCALPGALLASAAGFALPRGPQQLIACGAAFLAGLWYGRELIGSIYRVDFGTTWAFGEAARDLAWHPAWGPVLTIGGLALQMLLIRHLRAREDRPLTP